VTGELAPLGQPDDQQPELRASHEDRDRIVEALRIAAGDGRLTAEELDDRLELALTARTVRELTVLTADLPQAAQTARGAVPVPRELLRISHRGGNASQTGHWVVPRRIDIDVAGGNVLLDFTHAVITAPVLPVSIRIRGGNLRIITRPGVEVDAADVSTVGGNLIVRTPRHDGPVQLRVELSGETKGGNVRVQRRRRTFRQWLRALIGRPDPAGGSHELARR